jgi:hypothetical protein
MNLKRPLLVLAGLLMATLVAPAPPAEAIGVGECLISGTIRFTPSAASPGRGAWDIDPAVIQCQGVFNFVSSPRKGNGVTETFNGQGQQFRGSGSYQTVPSAEGGCLHALGEGTVDYYLATVNQDIHMKEQTSFLLAGAGTFNTPTLYGSFQIPQHDSSCLTGPPTTALFLAEVTMVRTTGAWK